MTAALILTAGLGTRGRPLTLVRAKPSLPVAGEPLVRRIIAWLARHGVGDVVLNLHHLPATVAAAVGDASDLGVRARYSWEQPQVLGSAGGPRHALDIVAASPFLIVNGDTLTDVDPRVVAARHRESGAEVTLALVPNTEHLHYGGAIVDRDGYVTGFVARGPRAAGSYHFIGVQVATADAFASLNDGVPASSIGGVYDALLARNPRAIAACVTDASFWDVGTPADYLRTSLAFAAGREEMLRGRRVAVAPSSRVADSVLWDDVTVDADCSLTRCIVTDGVRVPPGARYESAILMPGIDGLSITKLDGRET